MQGPPCDRREYIILQLTSGGPQVIDISTLNTQGLIGLNMWSYQFSGVPVAAGVPLSLCMFVDLQGPALTTVNNGSNNGSALAGIPGVPLPLQGAYTVQIYDTPKVFATRNGMAGLRGSLAGSTLNVRDTTGAYATFTDGMIYCEPVFETTGYPDLGKAVRRNHDYTFAEHVQSGVKRHRPSHE